MPEPVIVTVARAGTPEAATADFVCDGVSDEVEINAAIEAVVAAGGGVVRIAAGDYWTSRPIAVWGDGISIEGDPTGVTALRPAADWTSIGGPEGAGLTAVVNFVGVDNFVARYLTIESVAMPGSPPDSALRSFNGIQAIPTGIDGAGDICTNGVFEGNTVRMAQGHTYSIWSLRSEGMQIINNLVDGRGTVDNAHPAQEGIEIYGGRDVLISGNTIIGMGNAAIQLGGLAALTPDCSIEGIVVVNNYISYSRVGVWIGTTWSAENGPAHARNILVEDNVFESMFETGFQIRNWTGSTDTPPEVSGITFRNNQVQMLRAESSTSNPAAVWFQDATGPGATLHSDILLEGNVFTSLLVDSVPPRLYLGPNHSPFVGFFSFSGTVFRDNDLELSATSEGSRGVISHFGDSIAVTGNRISGAGIYPIEFYDTAHFSIEGNTLSEWGRGTRYSAIMVGLASDYSVVGNQIRDAFGDAAVHLINVHSSTPALSTADNHRIVEQNATLAGSMVQNLTLAGPATIGFGNGLDNIITGNGLANILDGGPGDDMLIGGLGDDEYVVDSAGDEVVELEDEGDDHVFASVSYALSGHVERLTLSGAAVSGTGNGLNNVITGNGLANILDGAPGDDMLIGGLGDDEYVIDSPGDEVVELEDEGDDHVFASVSYALSGHVERLTLTGAAVSGTGNGLNNVITGNGLANILDGGPGDDMLIGGAGDDIYIVDSPGDLVMESVDAGFDRIRTSVSYMLAAGSHIEVLETTDPAATTALALTGNNLAQEIWGNAGDNRLRGGGGNDYLIGQGGNDTYIVENLGASVIEAAGGGARDIVYSAVDYTLGYGQHIEVLSALSHASTAALSLTGNNLAQEIWGNAGNNTLRGGGGNDTLVGQGGNDTYIVENLGVVVIENADGGTRDVVYSAVDFTLGAGQHIEVLSALSHASTTAIKLTGNAFNNEIWGNAGNNILDGKGGNDVLIGQGGADTFAFTTALGAGNVDQIADFQAALDKIALDDAVFTGLTPGALNPNAFATGSAAADADDRIIYNSATGQLFFDADGSGAGAAVHFATLNGAPPLTASDFMVI